jgi:DNA-binding transcriptional LysR family regulator
MAQSAFTLRQLRYFVAAVEQGGVAQASRRLNISPPSVSDSIKKLEESFGVQLFIRHHASGVSLTPAGSRFYEHALELLRRAREFEQNARAELDIMTGRIEVGCFETVTPAYMPGLLAGFSREHPLVEVHLTEGSRDQLVAELSSGHFDVIMVYDYGLPADIERTPLLPPLGASVVLPKNHRLAGAAKLSLRQLASEPLILLDVKPSAEYFLDLFHRLGLAPNVAYRSPSIEMVRGLVGRGLGYSVLVTRPVHNLTYDGFEVVTIPVRDDLPPSNLVMAWHSRARLTKPSQAFVDYCKSRIATVRGDILASAVKT